MLLFYHLPWGKSASSTCISIQLANNIIQGKRFPLADKIKKAATGVLKSITGKWVTDETLICLVDYHWFASHASLKRLVLEVITLQINPIFLEDFRGDDEQKIKWLAAEERPTGKFMLCHISEVFAACRPVGCDSEECVHRGNSCRAPNIIHWAQESSNWL